jgi:hypothetical protein
MSDREAFKRLATKRVNKAINQLRLIGNLSNRSNYAYDKREVDKIFGALKTEIAEAQKRFAEAKKAAFRFSLKE